MNIQDMKTGECFKVICKRCSRVFSVIKNSYDSGIRRADNQGINPARCHCGSLQLELY